MELEDYRVHLLNERQALLPFQATLANSLRLLDQEINRVTQEISRARVAEKQGLVQPTLPFPVDPVAYDSLLASPTARSSEAALNVVIKGSLSPTPGKSKQSPHSPPPQHPVPIVRSSVKKQEVIYVPVDEHPNFNFVGRILGPRGQTLRQIEQETRCKIKIRGQGSIKDKSKEAELKNKPGWEHLKEPLHILIECELEDEEECNQAMSHACSIVNQLLIPTEHGNDMLKRLQLRDLAILNGTFREDRFSRAGIPPTAFVHPDNMTYPRQSQLLY